jgi:predicted protein tyrosine phosphatase
MQFIRPWLAVEKARYTRDLQYLRLHLIGAMLQIAEPIAHPGIESLYLPFEDGTRLQPETIRRSVDFVAEHRRAGRKVVIACGAGVSRSVTLAVAALKDLEEISLLEAYAAVRDAHREARPHPLLWQSLCSWCGEETPYLEVLRCGRG